METNGWRRRAIVTWLGGINDHSGLEWMPMGMRSIEILNDCSQLRILGVSNMDIS
jgi:hypothetical protein